MYLPDHFNEDRTEVMHQLIRCNSLAVLVTLAPQGLTANHVPMLIDPDPLPHGTLRGHVARANPLWREFDAGTGALAVFTGPQGYISPSWYPSKHEGGKVVPTWNYAVVHASGPLLVHDDKQWVRALVTRLTQQQESPRAQPWQVSDAPAEFIERMLDAIVGIEIPLTRLQGKWKMSQNRGASDRAGVAAGLRAERGEQANDMAQWVAGARGDAAAD
jgi:transcriptional regulator